MVLQTPTLRGSPRTSVFITAASCFVLTPVHGILNLYLVSSNSFMKKRGSSLNSLTENNHCVPSLI